MKLFKLLPPPAWFLLLAPAFIIESCITASTPPSHWLNPAAALLMIVAYGLPILMLREVWIRHKSSLRGLFWLGLVYGFINEGILAHTITQVSGEPLTHFIGYDEALGIHWAWASLIVPWHAFYSTSFMILLTHLWFPMMTDIPWLGKRGMRTLAGLNLILLPLYFMIQSNSRPAPVPAFFIYLALMGLFLWRGLRTNPLSPAVAPLPTNKELILTAIIALSIPAFATIAGFELAHRKIPLLYYFLLTIGTVIIILRCFIHLHPKRLMAFMLGGTVGLCSFTIIYARDPLYMIVAPLFLASMITSFRKLLKSAAPKSSAGN